LEPSTRFIKDKIAFHLIFGHGMVHHHLPIRNETHFTKLAMRTQVAEVDGEDVRDVLQKVAVEMNEGGFP
jgi:hypothetical protein